MQYKRCISQPNENRYADNADKLTRETKQRLAGTKEEGYIMKKMVNKAGKDFFGILADKKGLQRMSLTAVAFIARRGLVKAVQGEARSKRHF